MIKKINIKKIFILFSLGSVVLVSGCHSNKNISIETENYEVHGETDSRKVEEVTENNKTKDKVSIAETTSTNEVPSTTEEISKVSNYDQDIIKEFERMEEDVDSNINEKSDSFIDKAGDKVATMIGFIWYGEEINGYTFNELSDTAKEKILNIYYKVDSKIENKIPSYKEKIKDKYTVVSNFVKDKYADLKDKADDALRNKLGDEKYDKYKEKKDEIKDGIKEGVSDSLDDMREVKDKYKEKVKNWYEKKKSE